MAGIILHADTIIELQKFMALRKSLNWSVLETLGFLGLLWSKVMKLRENGDVTGWDGEYICNITGVTLDPGRVWEALVKRTDKVSPWIELREDGKVMVHDWLDYAGALLRKKYSSKNRKRLVEIWSLHGKSYGEEDDGDRKETTGRHKEERKRVANIPFLSFLSSSFPLPPIKTTESAFELLWSRYPKQDGKKEAYRHFCASVYEVKDWEEINRALQNYLNSERVKKGYVKNGSTWFNNWRDWVSYQEKAPDAEQLRRDRDAEIVREMNGGGT